MDNQIILDIFNLFIPFSVTFAILLSLMEYILQFILRTAFGRTRNKDII